MDETFTIIMVLIHITLHYYSLGGSGVCLCVIKFVVDENNLKFDALWNNFLQKIQHYWFYLGKKVNN